MKNRIKIVRRLGMPETNSSSSHAVSISMLGNYIKPGDPEWDIEIENGILKIPEGNGFGWEYFKSNTILTKLQYLCGIFCSDIKSYNGKKKIFKLKKILRELFNVQDVEFLWITEYSNRLKEVEDPEDAYYSYPEIDHNSYDIFEEITESKEVIKNYLFSRDSWLYGGNDNSCAPDNFYNSRFIRSDKVTAIVSVYFGEPFGRIDWELINFPSSSSYISKSLGIKDKFNILNNICYDPKLNKFKEFDDLDIRSGESLEEINKCLKYYGYNYNYPSPYYLSDGYYIIYTDTTLSKNLNKYTIKTPGENFEIQDILKKYTEGVNYIKVPVHIRLLEYGDYII